MSYERYVFSILRGEGNIVLSSECSQQDSNRVAEWLSRGSGYHVERTAQGVHDAVGPTGNWIALPRRTLEGLK